MIIQQKNQSKRGNRQRGIAIVEFVIVLPVVLFITLGVAEMGNAIRQYNALTQSVRDGTRHLAEWAARGNTPVNITSSLVTEVSNLVVYGSTVAGTPRLPGLTPTNVTLQDLGDGQVSVSASYAYQPLLIGGIPDLVGVGSTGGTFTMNAEVVMRAL
jgi:Flp pilus assembly protein TadG